ncbi:hypothetical protein [Nocardiopsis sp. YSL2]|uniref:hypothetical protein n=1 Tax=Nocardiopsis sp. YSL2 TaxID=2939492 RepID=UPI0026F4645D|nr:hypothetical protein [Nocardiopsis sp. YSL2]
MTCTFCHNEGTPAVVDPGNYLAGARLQRMDLCQPIDDFLNGPVRTEILRFRQADHDRLEANHCAPTPSPTTTHRTEGSPTV